jgi:hypothetical protein
VSIKPPPLPCRLPPIHYTSITLTSVVDVVKQNLNKQQWYSITPFVTFRQDVGLQTCVEHIADAVHPLSTGKSTLEAPSEFSTDLILEKFCETLSIIPPLVKVGEKNRIHFTRVPTCISALISGIHSTVMPQESRDCVQATLVTCFILQCKDLSK